MYANQTVVFAELHVHKQIYRKSKSKCKRSFFVLGVLHLWAWPSWLERRAFLSALSKKLLKLCHRLGKKKVINDL